jgi:hypothetical protein
MNPADFEFNYISPAEAAHQIRRANRLYVDGVCTDCGADVLGKNRTQHNNWHATFIHRSQVKDGFNVSAVKWCDIGDHAFKANSPGAQSLDIMQRDDNGGEERVTMDICGKHAFPTAQSPNPTMRAVEAAWSDQAKHNID